jgi:diguanylate cyclase (GGDEF)-like protein
MPMICSTGVGTMLNGDETRVGAVAPLPAQALLVPALPSAVPDWELMFNAVRKRLRLCADGRAPVQGSLLECVAALDQLQVLLRLERSRLQALELEIFDANTALAQARAELVGTQAGERQARHQSLHDGLTQLPNRHYFRERLEHALQHLDRQAPSLAVLYLDLDHFKPINDSHGHEVGDELLRIVATRLNRIVRNEDMVSRLGGDEFACLRAGAINPAQLAQLAGKLFDAVSAPLKVGALDLAVRPSIGIATYPADGTTAAALLKSADAAMYEAKRRQTHYAFFGAGGSVA